MSLLEQTPGLQEALQGETLAPARSAGVTPKFLATRSADGVPNVVPCVSILPAEALVAANILTFEAISYQAKGRWSASGRTGTLQVQQVYAGGPPYPGGRVA
jgi:hypothetical protein